MQVEVEINYVGLEGQGVGQDGEGNLYFVERALPGDRALVEFESAKKRYRDATLISLVRPSPDRQPSPCPHFEMCGGCDWLHWKYEAQIAAKEQSLTHILARAGLIPESRTPCLPSPIQFGYRTRVQVRQRGTEVGFLKRRSNDLVSVDRCPVAHPKINEAMAELRETSSPPRKVEISVDESGNVQRVIDAPHGALGFTQVNTEQNRVLRALIADWVRTHESRRVLELYCGDGNLTREYISQVEQVWGADLNAAALEKAARELPATFQYIRRSVDAGLARSLPPDVKEQYDTLILDPPRSGIGEALSNFLHPRLKTILYISCSPLTFSQDVKALAAAGFHFRKLQPLDMFPHTRHLELAACFTR
jgi:23S rRNA (uracil1939-C5)-methyltransferase